MVQCKCVEGKRMIWAAFLHPRHGREDSRWWIRAFFLCPGAASQAEPRSGGLRGRMHIAAHPGTDGTGAPSGARKLFQGLWLRPCSKPFASLARRDGGTGLPQLGLTCGAN